MTEIRKNNSVQILACVRPRPLKPSSRNVTPQTPSVAIQLWLFWLLRGVGFAHSHSPLPFPISSVVLMTPFTSFYKIIHLVPKPRYVFLAPRVTQTGGHPPS